MKVKAILNLSKDFIFNGLTYAIHITENEKILLNTLCNNNRNFRHEINIKYNKIFNIYWSHSVLFNNFNIIIK